MPFTNVQESTLAVIGEHQRDSFTVINAATKDYTLTETVVGSSEQVHINGVTLTKGQDYTISGTTLTIDSGYPLNVNDFITIKYNF